MIIDLIKESGREAVQRGKVEWEYCAENEYLGDLQRDLEFGSWRNLGLDEFLSRVNLCAGKPCLTLWPGEMSECGI